jgi:serine/threonine protein kinase
VWSLGIILLEIITGFPVWMSLKCRVSTVDGKSVLGQGIFGVQGREGKRILIKQQGILKNLSANLKKYECYGLDSDPYFMDLLNRMLDINPTRRISPLDIINHRFCQH